MVIEHIAMYVNDLEATKNFFVQFFDAKSNAGYHNTTNHFKSYFLSFDNGSRLEIMNKPSMVDNEKSIHQTGYIHMAFSVGSKEKVDRLTEQLRTAGYAIMSGPRTTGDGYYESCVLGIENNIIEITI